MNNKFKKATFTKNNRCRICANESLNKFFAIAKVPLNAMPVSYSENKCMDIEVFYCEKCGLVQLLNVISDEIYEEYIYTPSHSQKFKDYMKELANEVTKNFGAKNIIELGSGNGYFLKCLLDNGNDVLGFEPSKRLAKESLELGVNTISDYFSINNVSEIPAKFLKADMIIMRHVLEHINSFDDLMQAIDIVFDKNRGILMIEVPYLGNIIEEGQFYAFFHEHLSYFSLTSINNLLKKHRFKIIGGKRVFTEGGAMLIFAVHETADVTTYNKVVNREEYSLECNFRNDSKFTNLQYLDKFCIDTIQNIQLIKKFIKDKINEGKTIAAWGAGQRGISLINMCELSDDELKYVVDVNPLYEGLYIPGTNISVVNKNRIYKNPVDYILVFATGYIDSIKSENIEFVNNGGKFVSIIPKIKIY